MFMYVAHIYRNLFRHTFIFYALWATILILSFEHATYLYSYRIPRPSVPLDAPFATRCIEPDTHAPQANATIVMLARNSEVDGAVSSVTSLEKQFNRWFHYPIVFLNDQPWDEHFIKSLTGVASGTVRFEVISNDTDLWGFSESVDLGEAREQIAAQGVKGIKYGGLESYHHVSLQRRVSPYQIQDRRILTNRSRRFYDHEALQQYKWYWRVEPGVRFTCAIN